jgi:hypothetical protein
MQNTVLKKNKKLLNIDLFRIFAVAVCKMHHLQEN